MREGRRKVRKKKRRTGAKESYKAKTKCRKVKKIKNATKTKKRKQRKEKTRSALYINGKEPFFYFKRVMKKKRENRERRKKERKELKKRSKNE